MKHFLKIIRKYVHIGYFSNCILMITLYLIFKLYYLKYYDYFRSNNLIGNLEDGVKLMICNENQFELKYKIYKDYFPLLALSKFKNIKNI